VLLGAVCVTGIAIADACCRSRRGDRLRPSPSPSPSPLPMPRSRLELRLLLLLLLLVVVPVFVGAVESVTGLIVLLVVLAGRRLLAGA
jgi:hypothetical protein